MKKIGSVRFITVCAMLTALCVVLDRLSAMNEFFKVGLGFVPVVIAAILYGPLASSLVYGLADFLAATLFPKGAYFPGFTLSAILMGAIYGIFLYEWKHEGAPKKVQKSFVGVVLRYLYRVVTPTLLCSSVGMFLTTYWITILYGKNTYWANFNLRLTQYAILIPLNLVLIPALIHLCAKLKKFTVKRVKK